jgi:hypothetical protein
VYRSRTAKGQPRNRPPAFLGRHRPRLTTVQAMAEEFDPQAIIVRFQERARAVKSRGVPPIEGPERKRFIDRMQLDFQDFAMLGDARATLEDGLLTFTVDLRPSTPAE